MEARLEPEASAREFTTTSNQRPNPHWHIDYLLQFATLTEVWFTTSDRKLERRWAELLEDSPQFRAPIPRLGASDYRRSRASHLFFSKRPPSFEWFRERVRAHYEGVEIERYAVTGCQRTQTR